MANKQSEAMIQEIFQPFKKFEDVFKDKKTSFPKKIEAIIQIWTLLGEENMHRQNIECIISIIDWAKVHTLNHVLLGKWKTYKQLFQKQLLTAIAKTKRALAKVKPALLNKFKKVEDVIRNPWDDPVLDNLMQNPDQPLGEQEKKFFFVEADYLISFRLNKLCESHCEDLAFNLVLAFLKYAKLPESRISQAHYLFCYDLHIAMLFRKNRVDSIIALFKEMTLEDGLALIKRFSKKQVRISRIWRHYRQITLLACQLFAVAAITQPFDDSSEILPQIIHLWRDFSIENSMVDQFEESLRRIICASTSSQNIHKCCEIFYENLDEHFKPFIIEMLIRALTNDVNIEKQKVLNQNYTIDETTKRLANGFMHLGNIFKDTVPVRRECVLTAFSLVPTLDRLKELEDLAMRSGFKVLDTGQIWECKEHPPVKESDQILWECDLCHKNRSKIFVNYNQPKNFQLNDVLNQQTLGISPLLCDDLAVLLISPRYRQFSWFMKWEHLHKLCEVYLNNTEKVVKIISDLKFLDIDYAMQLHVKQEPDDSPACGSYDEFLMSLPKIDPDNDLLNKSTSSDESLTESFRFTPSAETKKLRQFRHNNKKSRDQAALLSSGSSQESNNSVNNSTLVQNELALLMNTPSTSKASECTSVTQLSPDVPRAHTPPFSIMKDLLFSKDSPINNINQSPLKRHASEELEDIPCKRELKEILTTTKDPFLGNSCVKFSHTFETMTRKIMSIITFNLHIMNDTNGSIRKELIGAFEGFFQDPQQHIKISNFKYFEDIFKSIAVREIDRFMKNCPNQSPQPIGSKYIMCLHCLRADSLRGHVYNRPQFENVQNNPAACVTNVNKSENQSTNNIESANNINPSPDLTEENKNLTNVHHFFGSGDKPKSDDDNKPKIDDTPVIRTVNPNDFLNLEIRNPKPNVVESKLKCTDIPKKKINVNEKVDKQDIIPKNIEPISSKNNDNLSSANCKPNIVNAIKKPFKIPPGFLMSSPVFHIEKGIKKMDYECVLELEKMTREIIEEEIENDVFDGFAPLFKNELATLNDNVINEWAKNSTKEIRSENTEIVDIPVEDNPKSNINNPSGTGNETDGESDTSTFISSTSESESSSSFGTSSSETDDDEEKTNKISTLKNIDVNENDISTSKIIRRSSRLKEKDSESLCDEESFHGETKDVDCCASKDICVDNTKLKSINVGKSVNTKANQQKSTKCYIAPVPEGEPTLEDVFRIYFLEGSYLQPKHFRKKADEEIIDATTSKSNDSDKLLPDESGECVQINNSPVESVALKERQVEIEQYYKRLEDFRNENLALHANRINEENVKPDDQGFTSLHNKQNIQVTYRKYEFPIFRKARVITHKLTAKEIKEFIPNYEEPTPNPPVNRPLVNDEEENRKYHSYNDLDPDMYSTCYQDEAYPYKIIQYLPSDHGIWNGAPTEIVEKNRKHVEKKIRKLFPAPPKKKYVRQFKRRLSPRKLKGKKQIFPLTSNYGNIPAVWNQVSMNPIVKLERIPNDPQYVRKVLSSVPGLNNYEMVRPDEVNQIVNVVQISGGRPATVQNQQSTQISPHIQRIGQPRAATDKPENSTNDSTSVGSNLIQQTSSTAASTTAKPSTSQPSALINILSQQMVRPTQTNNNCVRARTAPVINILSQQIIRPASGATANVVVNKTQTNSISAEVINSTPKIQTTSTAPPVTDEQQIQTNDTSCVKTVTATKTSTNCSTSNNNQGTILQFICKSSLPKFQQAFGKSVYQNATTNANDKDDPAPNAIVVATGNATETITTVVTTNSTNDIKKSPITIKNNNSTTNNAVNIQPIQGGVIYTRQMPVGQAINILPQGRGQVFRIATSNAEQISLVKDTVIHSKVSALLAAALQGKQKSSNDNNQSSDGENSNNNETTGVVTTRPTLVQNARIVKPVLQIPSNVIRTSPQPSLSSTTLEQLREFDMVYNKVKERSISSTPSDSNQIESNDSNSQQATAQQQPQQQPQQRISVTYLNNQGQKYTQLSPVVVVSSYCNLQSASSPALSVTSQGSSSPCVTPAPTPSTAPKVSSKPSKGKTVKNTTQASKASPIPKPQQKPQEDEHTTQRIFDILAEYAEQLRNSPDLNNKPAPRRRSNPPTNPSQNSKRKKSSSSKKSGQCSSMVSEADIDDHRTVGSEDSSCGVVQISVQEEDQPHIQTITTTTTNTNESNDTTSNNNNNNNNNSCSSSGSRQQLILTDPSNNQTRNLIIADSSVGEALKMPNTAVLVPGNYIMPVSMVKGGQQIAVVSGGSKILATVPARSGPNMLLFQSFLNQNRNKTGGVPTVKYSTIQPISGISSQNLAGVSGQPPVILPSNSHNLTAVTLGQPITLKKIDEAERVNTELLLTISQPTQQQTQTATTTQQQQRVVNDNSNLTNEQNNVTHPDSSNAITSTVCNIGLDDSIINSDNSNEKVVFHNYQKSTDTTMPIATPVIAQTSCINKENLVDRSQSPNQISLSMENNKTGSSKNLERVQTVLVQTSNGPMLGHSTPLRYRKTPESSTSTVNNQNDKVEFLHNGEKQNKTKKVTHPQQQQQASGQPVRMEREMQQMCLQRKQAAIERELRLQKSLSEECEDLGVDEPSTSDLFPEADILFDSNHSPSFDDQSPEDIVKRSTSQQIKADDENKSAMTLFSDDDSSSLRTDFLFESVQYHSESQNDLDYDEQNHTLRNGQSSVSNESGSSCGEDHTLLRSCASMSDVTLNSPISPDPYHDNTNLLQNKYKFKYSNRKKNDLHKQHQQINQPEQWTSGAGGEVSSSEDTTGSTDLIGKSPEPCSNKRDHSAICDDETSDGCTNYKVVRVAISKSELLKGEESCQGLHCDDNLDVSPSRRGARRSVKKMCSCCNGAGDNNSSGNVASMVAGNNAGVTTTTATPATQTSLTRKRTTTRSPHTISHKKAFLNKKR